tara:strand:+ start:61 stop:567 length:507 start_codon:yes stop_codon:yes gene_type:complete
MAKNKYSSYNIGGKVNKKKMANNDTTTYVEKKKIKLTPYEQRMADRKILKKKGIRPKKSLGSPNRSAAERERRSGSRFVEKVRKAEKTNPKLWKKVQEEVNAPNYKTNSSAKPKHRATIMYLKLGGGYKEKDKIKKKKIKKKDPVTSPKTKASEKVPQSKWYRKSFLE